MPINFGLNQPGAAFDQGFGIANRMMKLAADKHAGESLAKGDRKGAANSMAQAGYVEDADQITQRGLNQEQVAASTAASQASTASTTQKTGQAEDAEKLQFTMRAANTLKETVTRDGPQAAPAAFDMIAPLIRSRGVPDEQIAQIRAGLEKDPIALIDGLLKSTNDKLQILSLGAQAVDKSGNVVAENSMQFNPNVNVPTGGKLVNTQSGDVVAEGNAPVRNVQETWRMLSPSEAKAEGFASGVMVKRSNLGNTEKVDAPPAAARETAAGTAKISPAVEAQLAKIRDTNTKARDLASAADEFMRLNRKYKKTGGFMAMPFAKEMAGAFDTDMGRMNQIAETEIPKMRVAGSGTTSDRDATRFERAFLSTANKYDVNDAAAQSFKAYSQRFSDYNEYLEEYALRKGTLVGAQGPWDRYISDPKNDVLNDQGRAVLPDHTWREFMNWNDEGGAGGKTVAKSYTWTPEGGLKAE